MPKLNVNRPRRFTVLAEFDGEEKDYEKGYETNSYRRAFGVYNKWSQQADCAYVKMIDDDGKHNFSWTK